MRKSVDRKTILNETLILNVVTLWMLGLLFWICNTYPRHILEMRGTGFLFAIVLNAVYHAAYFIFLNLALHDTHILSKAFADSFESLPKKLYLSKVIVLLIIQIAADAVRFELTVLAKNYSYLVLDILTVLNWLLIYFVVTGKKGNLFSRRKFGITIGFLLIILLATMLFVDGLWIKKHLDISAKYQLDSAFFQNSILNLDYQFGVKSFIFNSLIGTVLVLGHTCYLRSSSEKASHSDWSTAHFLAKCFAMFFLFFTVIVIKMLAFPYGQFLLSSTSSEEGYSYVKDRGFMADTDIVSVYRGGEHHTRKLVYCSTKDRIKYNNKTL